MRIIAIVAAAAALAAPAAFAQSAVVVEGGPVLLEGPAASKPIRGAVIAQVPAVAAPGSVVISSPTTVMGAGPAVATTTTPRSTVSWHYWNMPADIESRMDFKRWHRLL